MTYKDTEWLRRLRERDDLREGLRSAVTRELTGRQRELFLLHFGEGMRLTECAREMNIAPATAWKLRERGLTRLRRCYMYALPEISLDKERKEK